MSVFRRSAGGSSDLVVEIGDVAGDPSCLLRICREQLETFLPMIASVGEISTLLECLRICRQEFEPLGMN